MKPQKEIPGYRQLYRDLIDRILNGKGHSPQAERRAAFDHSGLPQPLQHLLDKVVHYAYKVTDDDVERVKQSGVSEDQVFELVICAAAGQASRQYESGLAALEAARKEGGPHAS